MHMQTTKLSRERFVLIARDVLFAKHQHLPVEPRLIDLTELLVGERSR